MEQALHQLPEHSELHHKAYKLSERLSLIGRLRSPFVSHRRLKVWRGWSRAWNSVGVLVPPPPHVLFLQFGTGDRDPQIPSCCYAGGRVPTLFPLKGSPKGKPKPSLGGRVGPVWQKYLIFSSRTHVHARRGDPSLQQMDFPNFGKLGGFQKEL